MPTLRALSAQLMSVLRRNPHAERVHQDLGAQSFTVDVAIDPDRANRDPRRAFAAEVRGTMDRRAKRVSLTGVVSTGYLSGAHIELTADIINDVLHGELRLVPAMHAAR
jgi:hypothetical protein